MDKSSEVDRDALLLRLRTLMDAGRAEFEEGRAHCRVTCDAVELTAYPLDEVDLCSLSTEELLELERALRQLAEWTAYSKTPEFRLEMEHQCFAWQLQHRQATELPDLDEFYRQRRELEERLFGRPELDE